MLALEGIKVISLAVNLPGQVHRAAVSVASNIVEGCSRPSEADYLRFLGLAFSSLRETEYQLSLAHRLEYLTPKVYQPVQSQCVSTSKVLAALIRALRSNKEC